MANVNNEMNKFFQLASTAIDEADGIGYGIKYIDPIRDYFEQSAKYANMWDEKIVGDTHKFIVDGVELCSVSKESRNLLSNLVARGISSLLRDYKEQADVAIEELREYLYAMDDYDPNFSKSKTWRKLGAIIDYYKGYTSINEALEDLK